ncbi:DUF6364 family protein [Polaribacter sp. Hel_I_88]|uniref:DUF6364 family protein n=1 Tax=Polaribacter sp. Hel_I_88 TaxID=1250006 RepID=UPI00047DB39D|nr:DUF6364 family protein [Polaribacter sp. Hel_I_88]
MNTKLTLTVEEEVILKAKQYAKSKGRSLSDIVENYLKLITKKEDNSSSNISDTPISDSLVGVFKMDKDFDYKKDLLEALEKKYLK